MKEHSASSDLQFNLLHFVAYIYHPPPSPPPPKSPLITVKSSTEYFITRKCGTVLQRKRIHRLRRQVQRNNSLLCPDCHYLAVSREHPASALSHAHPHRRLYSTLPLARENVLWLSGGKGLGVTEGRSEWMGRGERVVRERRGGVGWVGGGGGVGAGKGQQWLDWKVRRLCEKWKINDELRERCWWPCRPRRLSVPSSSHH